MKVFNWLLRQAAGSEEGEVINTFWFLILIVVCIVLGGALIWICKS